MFADLFTVQLYNYILLKNSLEKEKKKDIIFKTDYFSYLAHSAAAQTPQSTQKKSHPALGGNTTYWSGWSAV